MDDVTYREIERLEKYESEIRVRNAIYETRSELANSVRLAWGRISADVSNDVDPDNRESLIALARYAGLRIPSEIVGLS